MHFQLNQAPQIAIDIFLSVYPGLKSTTPYSFIIFPTDVVVEQDALIKEYYRNFLQLFVNPVYIPNQDLDKYVAWQVLQCYRILNAAIVAKDLKLAPELGFLLCELKDRVETNDYVQLCLAQNSVTPLDVTCSGHGYCLAQDDLVTIQDETKVLLYSDLGFSIDNATGNAIENSNFNNELIVIRDNRNQRLFAPTRKFPVQYDKQTSLCALPNLRLIAGVSLAARIIEARTGRVLWENHDGEISLREIMQLFPNRRIHWAACSRKRHELDGENIGPNANLSQKMLNPLTMYPTRRVERPYRASHSRFYNNKKHNSSQSQQQEAARFKRHKNR